MGTIAVDIDEKIWRSFKMEVFRKYGTTTRINMEMQNVIGSYLARDAMMECLKNLSETYGFFSSEDVKKNRPGSKNSAGKVLRGMRDARASLS